MKKVLFLLICLLPSVATWAETTFDYAYDGQTLTYKVTDEAKKNCEVQRSLNISGSLTIPSEANGYTVTSIGIWAQAEFPVHLLKQGE